MGISHLQASHAVGTSQQRVQRSPEDHAACRAPGRDVDSCKKACKDGEGFADGNVPGACAGTREGCRTASIQHNPRTTQQCPKKNITRSGARAQRRSLGMQSRHPVPMRYSMFQYAALPSAGYTVDTGLGYCAVFPTPSPISLHFFLHRHLIEGAAMRCPALPSAGDSSNCGGSPPGESRPPGCGSPGESRPPGGGSGGSANASPPGKRGGSGMPNPVTRCT